MDQKNAVDKKSTLHGSMFCRSHCRSKFYIAEIEIFDIFAEVTLSLTRWPSYLTHMMSRCTKWTKMNFVRQDFRKLSYYKHACTVHTDIPTAPKLYTTPLCGWSIHRRSQGMQWVHLHPPGWRKKFLGVGPNSQGKFVSAPLAHQVQRQAEQESIFRTFSAVWGRLGAWISSFRPSFGGDD